VYLGKAKRSNRHDVVAYDIGVVTGRDAANIYFTLEEAVVDFRVASVNQNIVIVT
jgi:hypothetical protein